MSTRGFTLLEVLVALVITGLVLVGVLDGLRLGVHVQTAQRETQDAWADLDTVDHALRGIIAQSDPRAPFRGTTGTIDFVSELPEASGITTGWAEVGLGLDGRHRLVLRWAPYMSGRPVPAASLVRETALLDGLQAVQMSYWDALTSNWVDAWNQRQPPSLVRIRLVFQEGDRRRWPDFVIAPMRQPAADETPDRSFGLARAP